MYLFFETRLTSCQGQYEREVWWIKINFYV